MEQQGFVTSNEKLEFRGIVLAHLKRILEISSHELRDSSREVVGSSHTSIIEQEDTRYSYIQAIENLAYVLLPYYDEDMQKVSDKCIPVLNAYSFQISKWFRKEIEEIQRETNKQSIAGGYYINKKIEYAKILFMELNKLMKRVDYLKGAVYGEGAEQEVIADIDNLETD